MDKPFRIIEIDEYKEVLNHKLESYKTIVVIGFPNSGKTTTFRNVKNTEYITFVYQGENIAITPANKYIIPNNKTVIIDEIHSNEHESKVKEVQKNNKVVIIHNRIFCDDTKRSVDAFMNVYHELDYNNWIFFVKK
ncbi:MAG: hypothetical protein WC755_06360 [Candidatus Woesearchaeota archaeon]|jgi:predicted ATPase